MCEGIGTWDEQGDIWTDPTGQPWAGPQIVDRQRRSDNETRWPGHHLWPRTLYDRSVDVTDIGDPYQPGRIRKFAVPCGDNRRPVWHLGDIGLFTVGTADDCTYTEAAEILDVTVARINQLLAEGDLTAIPGRYIGSERVLSLASVLALDKERQGLKEKYVSACMAELAALLSDDLCDRGELFEKLRKRYSVSTIYAAKRKMGIKTYPPSHPGGKGRWALRSTKVNPAEDVAPPDGPIHTTKDGKLRPTARQMMRLDPSIKSADTPRRWAKRDSIMRKGEKALRWEFVPRPPGQTGRAKVPGYYWEDWETIKAGKEYKNPHGEGPGTIHANLYAEKVRQVKEELLKLIPQGSPSFRWSDPSGLQGWARRADEMKAVLKNRFKVNSAVITQALESLGGIKKKEVVPWSEKRSAQRRVTWNYFLPDSAYTRQRPAEERDLLWQRWSEEPGMSCGRIAKRHNRLNPNDNVSRETVKKALQRLRMRQKEAQ